MDSVGLNTAPPLSVREIADRATSFDYNNLIPLKYWLRTADTLMKESSIYLAEGNDQQAYLLLLRYVELILRHLQTHPDAGTPDNARALRHHNSRAADALKKLELLKPRIEARHESYMRERSRSSKHSSSTSSSSSARPKHTSRPLDPDRRVGSPSSPGRDRKEQPSYVEQQARALAVARQEFERREREKRERRAREQGRAHPLDSTGREIQRIPAARAHDPDELAAGIRALGMAPGLAPQQHTPAASPAPKPSYPAVPKRTHTPPAPYTPAPAAPPRPLKTPHSPPRPPPRPPKSPAAPTIPPKLPSAPRDFPAVSRLESGAPLRRLFLPSSLRPTFLTIAAANTARNLETCGILLGTLTHNAFFVTRLVVPPQTATSDSCAMTDEAALFAYCDAEELMPLGWIHTHPSQSCFMSSVDVHTHAGWQWQLAESVAVVCAPSREPDWGVFRLTDPPGMGVVGGCTERGFHEHRVGGLYTDALGGGGRPGHCVVVEDMGFDWVDLRGKT